MILSKVEAIEKFKKSAEYVGITMAAYLKVGNGNFDAILNNPTEEVKSAFENWQAATVGQQELLGQIKLDGHI